MKRILAWVALSLLAADRSEATCVITNTFSASTTAVASQVNTNFTDLQTCIVAIQGGSTITGTTTFSSTTSIILGTAGSAVGNIGFKNATSGIATLAPPTGALGTYTVTLPNAASTLPIFGQQVTVSGPTAARTWTVPDANFTIPTWGTGVQTALSVAGGSAGAFGVITYRANGVSVNPASLATTACNNTDISVSGVLSTDVVEWSFDGPVDGITGFDAGSTSGSLNIQVYPVADNIRVRTCNPTSGTLDGGAFTINYRVIR